MAPDPPRPLSDRAVATRSEDTSRRKNGLFLSSRSKNPSKVPVSASAKRLLSLLVDGEDVDEKRSRSGGDSGRPAQSAKRPRTEVVRPPSTHASKPNSEKNLIFLLQRRTNSSDAVPPPKKNNNVLDVYSSAKLPIILRPSTNLQPSSSTKKSVADLPRSAIGAARPNQSARLTGKPSRSLSLLSSSVSRNLPSHIVAKLRKGATEQNISEVDVPKTTGEGRNCAVNNPVPLVPEPCPNNVAAVSSSRPPPLPPVDAAPSAQATTRIGLAGLAANLRGKSGSSSRFVDRQLAPRQKASVTVSQTNKGISDVAEPPTRTAKGDAQSGATIAAATFDPPDVNCSAVAETMELPVQLPPRSIGAPGLPLASTMDIPRLTLGNDASTSSAARKPPTRQKPTDNFVRLNLKNNSGSCRGRRSVRSRRRNEWSGERKTSATAQASIKLPQESFLSTTELMDPVDDFLDGVYHPDNNSEGRADPSASRGKCHSKDRQRKQSSAASEIPKCRGHNLPCKLRTVKKTSNKGRKFWVCSLPREEQCQHFQWAEDCQQAAQQALLRNTDISGFVARRVASHMRGLALLTVPELRQWLDRRGVDCTRAATKPQLKTKAAIWIRDQVVSTVPERDSEDVASEPNIASERYSQPTSMGLESDDEGDDDDDDDADDDDSTSSSDTSDEELEVLDAPTNDAHVALARDSDNCDPEETASVTEADEPVSGCPLKRALKSLFGYSSFREGQEWAIQRCIDNKRTLLVAPTGFGKSLCYAIPAAIKEGVCIVVSPLLSLIQDQLRMLPPQLAAVTLSGSLSTTELASTLDDIIRNRIKIVFVSPERLASPSFRRMFMPVWNAETASYQRRFPKVSLLCVDEAHCLSQWAHNFRPSFLRLRSVVEVVRPESILAVTATAGSRVVQDISQQLGIRQVQDLNEEPADGVLILKTNRDNIDVTSFVLSTQEERLNAPSRAQNSNSALPRGCLAHGSVIVYVWRQRDAEVVAENIQTSSVNGGVVVYHGGMKSSEREKAQSKFFRGKARICVATVAFGLGIDKSDVRGVIHMSLASSMEHYLQEIGRAGRDGNPAKAIALVLPDEAAIRHSLSHSDMICRSQTQRVLEYVRRTVQDNLSSFSQSSTDPVALTIGLPLVKTAVGCDCKAETIETLISLLELSTDGEPYGYVDGVSYDRVMIAPKRRHLASLAEQEPVVRAIVMCNVCVERPAGETKLCHDVNAEASRLLTGSIFGAFEFSVAHCATALGPKAEPRHIFAALRRLEREGEIDLALDTSPRGKALLLRLTPFGTKQLSSSDDGTIRVLVDRMHEKLATTIRVGAAKTLDINRAMLEVSQLSGVDTQKVSGRKSASLAKFQALVEDYFETNVEGAKLVDPRRDTPFMDAPSCTELSCTVARVHDYLVSLESGLSDVDDLSLHVGDSNSLDYTALAITKFLHGIGPSRWNPSILRNNHLFGRLQGVHFEDLEAVVRVAISS